MLVVLVVVEDTVRVVPLEHRIKGMPVVILKVIIPLLVAVVPVVPVSLLRQIQFRVVMVVKVQINRPFSGHFMARMVGSQVVAVVDNVPVQVKMRVSVVKAVVVGATIIVRI
tara:strand:- start:68 stop:403 length:336 start_codon:yes stop_codon:yes gene_type:complete